MNRLSVKIDGVDYSPTAQDMLVIESEAKRLLCDLYAAIWVNACYDPDNEQVEKFCVPLLPKIQRLNEILRFKW